MRDARDIMDLLREPVDLNVLNDLAEMQGDGEPDLVCELIDLYLADTSRHVAVMRQALATTDDLLLAREAHSLRGSSSTLGAHQVAETCDELERLAHDVALERGVAVLERLEQELASVRNAFLSERQKRSGLMK